jgi:hypothetical protein
VAHVPSGPLLETRQRPRQPDCHAALPGGTLIAINNSGFLNETDVAPFSYPIGIGVWGSVLPCWAVMAAVRGAEPSTERSVADRRTEA